MKRLFFLGILFVMMVLAVPSVTAGPNPIVKRLSAAEIEQCVTPSAVAYNYVAAIVMKDSTRMRSMMTSETLAWFDKDEKQAFTMQNLVNCLPLLCREYEIAVMYVQDFGDKDEYGRPMQTIYVGCVPSNEVGSSGFQEITKIAYAKVVVIYDGGRWKAGGFK